MPLWRTNSRMTLNWKFTLKPPKQHSRNISRTITLPPSLPNPKAFLCHLHHLHLLFHRPHTQLRQIASKEFHVQVSSKACCSWWIAGTLEPATGRLRNVRPSSMVAGKTRSIPKNLSPLSRLLFNSRLMLQQVTTYPPLCSRRLKFRYRSTNFCYLRMFSSTFVTLYDSWRHGVVRTSSLALTLRYYPEIQ